MNLFKKNIGNNRLLKLYKAVSQLEAELYDTRSLIEFLLVEFDNLKLNLNSFHITGPYPNDGWKTVSLRPSGSFLILLEIFSLGKNQDEVEFFLVLQFDSLEAVKTFAGDNYEKAYIPENAQRILKRYDETAEHFELKEELIL